MFKYRPLRYELPIKEPGFTFFSHHSAAMLLKKRFTRTLSEQFSLAKAKFKHGLKAKRQHHAVLAFLKILHNM
jgi:hypothetical protein